MGSLLLVAVLSTVGVLLFDDRHEVLAGVLVLSGLLATCSVLVLEFRVLARREGHS